MMAHFKLTFLLSFCIPNVQGAVLTHEKLVPSSANNNSCAVVTCDQKLRSDDLYVQKIDVYNIGQNGSKLATVFAQAGKQELAADVSMDSRSFSRSMASIKLAIRNSNICNRGSFMCEVTYINDEFGRNSDISIIRPNSDVSNLDSVHEKLDSLTASVNSLKSSVKKLQQCLLCQGSSPTDVDFPSGWTLAFRGTSAIHKSVFDAYKTGTGIPANVESGCKQVDSSKPCTNHYRNNEVLNNWKGVNKVAFVLYEKNALVAYMVFDGRGTDNMNWFSQEKLELSSWTDLKTSSYNFFSIEGDLRPSNLIYRRFIVNKFYGGCGGDLGWFSAADFMPSYCPWEGANNYPSFAYVKGSNSTNWSTGKVGYADVMAIYVN
ncbi:hypothetical protein BgiBS90_036557 [Biomphalaria glabrata]|nr:hypothetical protein BgiBS90_036557 [Biomphalaria glabrata]